MLCVAVYCEVWNSALGTSNAAVQKCPIHSGEITRVIPPYRQTGGVMPPQPCYHSQQSPRATNVTESIAKRIAIRFTTVWVTQDVPLAFLAQHREVHGHDVEMVGASARVVQLLTHSAKEARFQVSGFVLPQPPPADSCSKPISILVPPVPFALFADASALSLYTPPAHSNSLRLPVASLKIVPPELRNAMAWPLSATCPIDMIDLCKRVVLGMEVVRHFDSVTCAQCRSVCRLPR